MQNEAKIKIKSLVEKYEQAKSSGRLKSYSEEETKKDFILPLFAALGWDIYDKKEVSAEESIKSSGRVDYGFYLNERPKFYLEAKAFKADLNKEEFAKQAIRYSWNRGVTWAVLTNFESLKVFNAQAASKYLGDKQYFEIPCGQFLEQFDQLCLLSKQAFGDDLIDKEAEKIGKKLQKVSVGALLYKDLSECRELLTKELKIWNKNLDKDLLDEGVQKILDRLIFIRVAEDRGVEPPTLLPLKRQWEASKSKESLYKAMVTKFRELDAIYDSNLFSPHPFENWQEDSGATEKVIDILSGEKGYYDYDFKVMPADVLGGVYENFLGHRLAQLKKGESGKDLKKRKEQGIYYTPPFIVEYIVKKALKPVLDKCKSVADLKKIKVLDPACGSGSFLVKALETINDKYKEFGASDNTYTKLTIVLENLYGVDLDSQAVDIARLNLLINCLDEKIKFPPLSANIKNGNSLISGTDEELRKYFGLNFREKKPFNWEEEFPEVFKQGGFDVVIGNPPWGAELGKQEKQYFKNKFKSGKGILDTYALFIEKSLIILKDHGNLGFVLPDIVLLKNYSQIRKLILDTCIIKEIFYTGRVFSGVNLDTVVFWLLKEKSDKLREDNLIKVTNENGIVTIKQKVFRENEGFKFNLFLDDKNNLLKQKIDKDSTILGDVLEIHEGVHSGNIREKLFVDKQENSNYKKLLFKGTDIKRYYKGWGGKYINYDKNIIDKKAGEYANLGKPEYFLNEKILVRRTGDKIIATIDNEKFIVSNNFFVLYNKDNLTFNLKLVLAVLNSKLGTWYFTAIQPRRGKLFAEIKINHLNLIPLHKDLIKSGLEKLVDLMFSHNKELQESSENSDKWHKLKEEIDKTDHKIDEMVYKLYGLNEEEIKTIEETIDEQN